MRARSIAVFFAVSSAILLIVTITASLNLPLYAQQSGTTAGAGPAAALPSEVQAKLDKLQADLKTALAASNAWAEAKTLNGIGDLYFGVSAYPQAQAAYSQALTLARMARNAEQEAAALNGTGDCYRTLSQNDKALEAYQQALEVATASGDVRGQAAALNGIGWVNANLGQFQKSLEFHSRALTLARQAKDRELEATILRRTGIVDSALGEQQKALDLYNQALPVFRQGGDRDNQGATLNNIGSSYLALGELQKALDFYSQARSAFRDAGDSGGEAKALNNSGAVCHDMGDLQKASDFYSQALGLFRQAGDRDNEAGALMNIGGVQNDQGEKLKALDFDQQALTIYRQAGAHDHEADALENIGNVYSDLGEKHKALDFFQQALTIFRQVGDHPAEAATLNDLALVYQELDELQKALDMFNEALLVQRQVGDRLGEALALANIGTTYYDLGELKKALDFYDQALLLLRQAGDQRGEAATLLGIGNIYSGKRALDFFNQALGKYRASDDHDGEARTLSNIGLAYFDLGQKQRALAFYHQALLIFRQLGDRTGEAGTLCNSGDVYRDLGEPKMAMNSYRQALDSSTAVNNPLFEAASLHGLMLNQKSRQPALAIFYGKQAVNFVQQVRGNIQGLDKELQKRFVSSKGDYYHDLADLLVTQGRLPEAQQVLDLLKHQEYSDYVRGESVDPASPLSLTPAERQAEEDYQASTAQLVSLGERWSQLKKISTRTPDEEKQYQQLSDELTKASQGLNDYYSRLYTLFGQNSDANKQVADVKGDVSLLKQTIAKMPNTVALYTLVSKDRYSVIVITGPTSVAREYAISEKDLNKKVADFQQVLRNPARDAKPLAHELYTILVGPVKADLNLAKAQTLVWSLDGVLRYIPMAALYDGKQYMVENYNTVTITPVSIPHLAEKPDVSDLSAVAMGISRKYEDSLPALPSVADELDEVVKDAQAKDARGVLVGTILLNDKFTETAMENQLSGQHTVVHIASHFVFKPGDDSQSYLLLAGKDKDASGYHLTVADFRDNQKLSLEDADLLTLSACETGMSGNASNGREIDGLGTTAQLKGAKAVISSLWEVNDASTGELMADFYKRWVDGGGKVAKVEALREAQLDLLLGKVTRQSSVSDRGINVVGREQDVQTGYTHPYYWAPFVLMGNWK